MTKTIMEELEKISLKEDLVAEGFDEEFADGLINAIENPQEPAYVCKNKEELTKAIEEMMGIKE